MIGRSKELEDVGRVASSFPTYLGKIEATLLAGYACLRHKTLNKAGAFSRHSRAKELKRKLMY